VIPFNPCSLPKVITAVPAVTEENVVETPTIDCPIPTSLTNLSTDSLVILFLRSLVTTSPSGALFANVDAEFGLAFGLSLSNWGYRSTIFWEY